MATASVNKVSTHNKRIVVLISGSGSNLQALLDSQQAGELNGEIVAVISNRPGAYGLTRAENTGVAALTIDHKEFPDRESFDQSLAQAIDQYEPDLIVLAGFMRILSEGFVRRYLGKMLNIHPSLLPKYPGLNTHQRALEAGDKQHGVSIHFVTPELDGGPSVLQGRINVQSDDTVETLQQRVHKVEHQIYPLAVRWFCEQRLELNGELVLLDCKPLKEAESKFYDL